MAKKVQKNYRIDGGIANTFSAICDAKGLNRNIVIEDLMKQYSANDGQKIFDEIYAPLIAKAVQHSVKEQVERLAKMIYQTQTNSAASLFGTPLFHIEGLKGMEDILESYLDPRVLKQDRRRISETYTMKDNGLPAVAKLRKIAHDDVQKRKKESTPPKEEKVEVAN